MKAGLRFHFFAVGMSVMTRLTAAPALIGPHAELPDSSGLAMFAADTGCRIGPIERPLELLEAVERALCNSAQTRQTWAELRYRAAQVSVSEAAFWPTLSATASNSSSYTKTIDERTDSGSKSRSNPSDYALTLNWTLIDFGLRRANLDAGRQLLAVAGATQQAVLQAVFMTVAQAYYDLLSAQAALLASGEAEQSARQSFMAADAKYRAGAGALADKLQAQTTLALATLDLVKARGNLNNAHGALSIAMGMPVDTTYVLADDVQSLPDTSFVQTVDALLDDAKRHHPSLAAAQAQLMAAEASVRAAKAEQWPTVSLAAGSDHRKQSDWPISDTATHSNSIGIQISIPLFDGFGRQARVRAAHAQVDAKIADLVKTEQQVALEVWTSYQSLTTETENLRATLDLLESAMQSFNVAQGRYRTGVGTIIELLGAQSALANAKQQRIHALSNWRIARLKLATSLGRLGFWAIR